MTKFSIIIPVLNEAESINQLLTHLSNISKCELIIVDGGSTDDTIALAQQHAVKLVNSPCAGRAVQMNLGAKHATGDVLLFLHADTQLPERFEELITFEINKTSKVWGRFDVRLSSEKTVFRVIEYMMNMRSRITGIATGDQVIFVERTVFDELGGFPNIPLMEDVLFSKQLKKISSPIALHQCVITSSRRWEEKGVWRTIFLMWRLRLAFFLGVSPNRLVKKYY